MAHGADSIKEPSYSTLANLAEILGTTIYNSPALASSKKLDEATVPGDAKLDMGIVNGVTYAIGKKTTYNVKLNSGAVVKASGIAGVRYMIGYEVAVLQNNTGEYIIISGGDESWTSEYGNQIFMEALSYTYSVTDTNRNIQANNKFKAFDTNDLILVIKTLLNRIDALERRFNDHTHKVAQALAQPVEIKSTDVTNLKDYVSDYEKSHTDRFQINY